MILMPHVSILVIDTIKRTHGCFATLTLVP